MSACVVVTDAGDYSTDSRPPGREVKITATNRDRCDVEPVQLGTAERYRQLYRVWNYNDSPAYADLIATEGEPA
ncbi:MAG: hypothetical protein M3Y33_18520 [Actinomycetota bacterium]|nr:hypothetical protein [Actinomycetota bacterium]